MEIVGPVDDLSVLKSIVLNSQCVAFVGAGLSNPPGADWNGLVMQIASVCAVPFDSDRLLQVIDLCLEKDEATCNDAMKQALPRHTATTRTALTYVHRLPFKALLTTNFDPWVHQLSHREMYPRYFVYPNLPLNAGLDHGLYYLHGYFNSDESSASVRSLVFGEKSFEEAYGDSLLPGFLLSVFVYSNILFIVNHRTDSATRRRVGVRHRDEFGMSSGLM